MRIVTILKVLGVILTCFSFTMLIPLVVDYIYVEHNETPFLVSFSITFLSGFILLFITYFFKQKELEVKDGFIIVIGIWVLLAVYGAFPYWLSSNVNMSFESSLFESMSGFTTTGASAIANLDLLSRSLLYYRQQTQFFGGMGIIVLAVAILPMIGVGGIQLYRAEANGDWKDSKLAPKIMTSAKYLWLIYIGLTAICFLIYKLCGMSYFDAISYSYATIGTGGFAPHNDGISYYNSYLIYGFSMFFMIISATSFTLHFYALKNRSIKGYLSDGEFKNYIAYIFVISFVVCFILIIYSAYSSNIHSIWEGVFHVVSFATNTGFTTNSSYEYWPGFIPVLLIMVGVVGGCAGSTSGGLKIIRALLIKKQVSREVNKLLHPQGIFPLKIGKQVLSDKVLNAVWGFVAGFFIIFLILWMGVIATGVNDMTALSAVAACLSNVGPGMGEIAKNYSVLPSSSYYFLEIAMLVGRLEVFTVLVLFLRAFWRS